MSRSKTSLDRTSIFVLLALGLFLCVQWFNGASQKKLTAEPPNETRAAIENRYVPRGNDEEVPDGAGTISREAGRNTYTNNVFKFKLSYPDGWMVDDNRAGTLRLKNYDPTDRTVGFNPGENKIDMVITPRSGPTEVDEEESPGISIETENVVIGGVPALRSVAYYPAPHPFYMTYYVPLPGQTEQLYLMAQIWGDDTNFHILDEMMQAIEWF